MILLVSFFFWVHYFFSSITSHAAAVLPVVLAVGTSIPGLSVPTLTLLCVYSLGLMGVISPYATGPAPMYFGSGYIGKGDFWKFGLIFGVIYFAGLLVIVLPWLQTDRVAISSPRRSPASAAGAWTRRKRSTIRVPAWAGSRSTLASSLDAIAETMRWPMPVERGSVLTLRPTPSSAIDSTRSSPSAFELDMDRAGAVGIGVFHGVHHQLVDDDADRHRAVRIDLDRLGLQRQPRHPVALGRAPQILQQRFEILVQQHALQVVRGVEPAMHLRDRGDAAHRIGQRRLDVVLAAGIGLQVQQRGDDLQTVADAVVDLAQQHLAFGGERRVAVARGVDLGLGLVAGLLNRRLPQRAVDGDLEQRNEIALHVLDQIVGRAGLQRGDGDRRILRRRDEHHRRRVRDRQDPLQRLQAVEAGHVLVERDDVDAALRAAASRPCCAARRHARP